MTPDDETLKSLAAKALTAVPWGSGAQVWQEYIVAATPSTVLSLLERLSVAEARLSAAERVVEAARETVTVHYGAPGQFTVEEQRFARTVLRSALAAFDRTTSASDKGSEG